MLKKILKKIGLVLIVLIITLVVWQATIQPSNNRNWQEPLKVLAYADFNGDNVTVHNIRNFHHRSATDYTVDYYDKTFKLSDLQKVYFIVEPYSKWEAAAHTFVSFQFGTDDFLAITIEARMEQGETYAPLPGALRQYEIMYIVGDERDVVLQRTNILKHDVFVYPIKTTPEKARALFTDMIQRATDLKDHPAFYNTITDSCTSSIVKHINKITPNKVPFSYKYFLPGYSDELAREIGLLDTDLSIPEARQKFRITSKAQAYGDNPGFSQAMRQF